MKVIRGTLHAVILAVLHQNQQTNDEVAGGIVRRLSALEPSLKGLNRLLPSLTLACH
jgi:hypothetical protein